MTKPSENLVAAITTDPKNAQLSADWTYKSPLIVCRFEPNGRFVFSSAHDCSVQRWNLTDGKVISLQAHESWVWAIGFSPDGGTTYTAGGDGRLIWWPTAADSPKPARTIAAHSGWVRCLAVSPDGRLLATGGNDQLVKIWNAAEGTLVCNLIKHESPIYSLLFIDSGSLLAGDLRGNVYQWDVASGSVTRSFDASTLHTYNGGEQYASFGGVRGIALSHDRKYLACAGLFNAKSPMAADMEPLVLRFDWESQKLIQSHVAGDLKGCMWRVAFHPDGNLIGVCGQNGKHLLFWNSDQDKDFHRIVLPSMPRDFDLHPDGKRLVSSHPDRHLRITTLAIKQI